MSSTRVARLLISRRSPPMFLAISARSGMVVTTRILASAPVQEARSMSTTESTTSVRRFMADSLAVAEAMHVASEDGGPLQEDLIRVGGLLWSTCLVHIGVLQAETLELREPESEVRRVGFGIANAGVESLRIVEEEPGIEAAAQPCLEVAV